MERDYDIGLREYQERIQNERELPKYASKIIDRLIEQGVIPSEAEVLAHFSVLVEVELDRAESYEKIPDDPDDMGRMCHFKVNNDGHMSELYLHYAEQYHLTLLPRMLCKLEHLEVICFPNNIIKPIPEWIINLKSLRVLDVSNDHRPNPEVLDSIKSFIESLESFNEFYR